MDLKHFDDLPDSALVPVTAFSKLMGIAVSTAWRRAKAERDFPKPVRLSDKCTRWKVADIRRFMEGRANGSHTSAAPVNHQATASEVAQ